MTQTNLQKLSLLWIAQKVNSCIVRQFHNVKTNDYLAMFLMQLNYSNNSLISILKLLVSRAANLISVSLLFFIKMCESCKFNFPSQSKSIDPNSVMLNEMDLTEVESYGFAFTL